VALPEIVRRVVAGRAIGDLPGVFSRRHTALPVLGQASGNAANVSNAPTVAHLDDLPMLSYDDYFGQLSQSGLPLRSNVWLMFETARGCWWGEKHHCTFCGLNGQGMPFRSKTASRALDEFSYLTGKYPGFPVTLVDNILDMNYFKDFIPGLAERNPGVEVFYEIKSNLKKEQLRMLRAAGVSRVQPGIESLSDQVLHIMDKGVRALQNIQLLKWCKELDIWPQWNFIWGFPGEDPAEYARMAELAPLLAHLPPPLSTTRIRIDRFSPNYDKAEQMGFKNLEPYPAYHYVYGLPPKALENLAYYFTFEYREARDAWQYVEPLVNEIAKWQQGYSQTTMFWVEKGERLLLWDERPVAQEAFVILTGPHKFAYQACDQTRTAREVFKLWQQHSPASMMLKEMRATLDELVARGLMLRQNDSYLALAVPQTLA
jgi:ribosomal peptide maturation radical SAM protein 1